MRSAGARRRCAPTHEFAAFVSMLSLLLLFGAGCAVDQTHRGLPTDAQATIDQVTDEITEGRFDQVYDEAAEEWRRQATIEQSRATLERLRNNLGKVVNRAFVSGTERQSGSADLPGHSLVVIYHTRFERADGMETFTLVERGGRWLLARYFVNSDALK